MTEHKKPLKVISLLAHEIYGENVIVDVIENITPNVHCIDIYRDVDSQFSMLTVEHEKAYDLMIELLRNIKRVNKDENKRNRGIET